jgi:hypothetical protein
MSKWQNHQYFQICPVFRIFYDYCMMVCGAVKVGFQPFIIDFFCCAAVLLEDLQCTIMERCCGS